MRINLFPNGVNRGLWVQSAACAEVGTTRAIKTSDFSGSILERFCVKIAVWRSTMDNGHGRDRVPSGDLVMNVSGIGAQNSQLPESPMVEVRIA